MKKYLAILAICSTIFATNLRAAMSSACPGAFNYKVSSDEKKPLPVYRPLTRQEQLNIMARKLRSEIKAAEALLEDFPKNLSPNPIFAQVGDLYRYRPAVDPLERLKELTDHTITLRPNHLTMHLILLSIHENLIFHSVNLETVKDKELLPTKTKTIESLQIDHARLKEIVKRLVKSTDPKILILRAQEAKSDALKAKELAQKKVLDENLQHSEVTYEQIAVLGRQMIKGNRDRTTTMATLTEMRQHLEQKLEKINLQVRANSLEFNSQSAQLSLPENFQSPERLRFYFFTMTDLLYMGRKKKGEQAQIIGMIRKCDDYLNSR